jgi:hypothetical protein
MNWRKQMTAKATLDEKWPLSCEPLHLVFNYIIEIPTIFPSYLYFRVPDFILLNPALFYTFFYLEPLAKEYAKN